MDLFRYITDIFDRNQVKSYHSILIPTSQRKQPFHDQSIISFKNDILSRHSHSIIFFTKCFVFLNYLLRIEEKLLAVSSELQRSWALKPLLCVMRVISAQTTFKRYLLAFITFFCRQMKRFVFLLETMCFLIWRTSFASQRIITLMYVIFIRFYSRQFILAMVFSPKALFSLDYARVMESNLSDLRLKQCSCLVQKSTLFVNFCNSGRDAKDLAMQCGIPVVPGYNGSDQSLSRLKDEVKRIGFPVLLKATMGGGGRVRS